jgi:mRNA interferase MazF
MTTRNRVVLVSFPFDDLTAAKVRPAVCLTDPVGSQRHVVVGFLTSRVPADLLETDLLVESGHPDFAEWGLRTTSVLRLHRLLTVTTRLFLRELGSVPESSRGPIAARLTKLFEMPP